MDRMLFKRNQSDVDKSPDKPTKSEVEKLQKIALKESETKMEKMLKKAKIPFKKK